MRELRVPDRKELPGGELSSTQWVTQVEFRPGNKQVMGSLVAGRATILWNASTGDRLAVLPGYGARYALDGRCIVTYQAKSGAGVLGISRKHFEANPENVTSKLWNVDDQRPSEEPQLLWSLPGVLRDLSSNGEIALTQVSNGRVEVWSTTRLSVTCLAILPEQAGGVVAARFGPDNSHVIVACGDGYERVWTMADQRPLIESSPDARIVAISGDAPRFLQTTTQGLVLVRDCADASLLAVIDRAPVNSAAVQLDEVFADQCFHPQLSFDGRRAVIPHADGRLEVWDIEARRPLVVLQSSNGSPFRGPIDGPQRFRWRFSPDGTRIVILTKPATVWDADLC